MMVPTIAVGGKLLTTNVKALSLAGQTSEFTAMAGWLFGVATNRKVEFVSRFN